MSADWRWFVPGRLEVFGKHTDYAGGHSLVAAVPRGITVSAWAADDGLVTVTDVGRAFQARQSPAFQARQPPAFQARQEDQRAEFPVRGGGPTNGWRRYVAAVVGRLASNFPEAQLSARIDFSSNLPRASGISSSSALVIAIAEALIARSGIEQTARWQHAIRSIGDRVTYFACMENGASFGPLEGDAGVGTHGGSEDHAAILTSRAGFMQQFSFSPLRLDRSVRMPDGWTFVVASTGITARKAGEARDDYNLAAARADGIVSAWRERHANDRRTLGELVRDGAVHQLELPAALRERLEHFIAEDARVPQAADALASADVERLGSLARESQDDARRLLGNQLQESEDLVAAAGEEGAAAASGFGAGWGGSVWALVPSADAEAFLERWIRAYHRRHPHLLPAGFVSPPSDGVTRISSD